MLSGMFSVMGILHTMITKNDRPDYPFGRVPGTLVIGVEPFYIYLLNINIISLYQCQ